MPVTVSQYTVAPLRWTDRTGPNVGVHRADALGWYYTINICLGKATLTIAQAHTMGQRTPVEVDPGEAKRVAQTHFETVVLGSILIPVDTPPA